MPDISKMPPLPDVHFGKVQDQPKEDAELPEVDDMDNDDDELCDETDPSVVEILGFDPLEWEDEDKSKDDT
jgi:hypothetical protein